MEVVFVVAVVGDGIADGGAGAVHVADDVIVVALPPAEVDAHGAALPLHGQTDLGLQVGEIIGVRQGGGGDQLRRGGDGVQEGGKLRRSFGGDGLRRGGVSCQQVQRCADQQRQHRGDNTVFHRRVSLSLLGRLVMGILYRG